IENNSAANYGGGVAVYTADSKYCESNNVTAIDCVFRNNSAVFGGGMALGFYDKCLIYGCTFDGNKTSNSGAALYVNFGTPEATRVWFTDAKGLINNSSFVNNTSERSGGALMVNDAMPNVEFNVVNTTFAGNRIDAKSSTLTQRKKFGGAAIQATLAEIPASPTLARVRPASLNLGHVTMTGNHAKCASATGFFASALNVTDGNVKILNSIIAGNSTNGTDAYADITATKLAAESYNIYTAPTTVNFTPDATSVTATSAEEGTAAIAGMLQGSIENGIYNPYVLYTDNEPTPFVPVESTMFGTVNVAKITSKQRSIEKEFNIDIDRNGSIGDVLTTDQLGRIRNTDSMPGAVEFCSDYSGTEAVEIDGNSVIVDVQPGGYVHISAHQAIGTISVMDMTGRTVAAANSADTDYTLDLTGVQRGIYIICCCNKAYKILIQ
ncbi:MAG: hypothetical protein K2M76_05965, partial [Muribaculaceae bacterium]|nr:hypothetical protein [Muribaculaceae bacterium]